MKKKVFLCAAVCALVLAMGVGCSQQSSSSESGTSSNTSNVQSESGSQTQNSDVPVSSVQGGAGTASDNPAYTRHTRWNRPFPLVVHGNTLSYVHPHKKSGRSHPGLRYG